MGGLRKHAKFNGAASLAFGAVGAQPTVLTTFLCDNAVIEILNTLNQDVELTFPNEGGAEVVLFPARASVALSFVAGGLQMCAGTVLINHCGTAPTSGRISIFGLA